MNTFATRLKEARGNKQMSMEELGVLVGVKKTTIWNYEHMERQPKISVAIALAKALGVEWEWLTGLDMTDKEVQLRSLVDALHSSQYDYAIKYLKFLVQLEESE